MESENKSGQTLFVPIFAGQAIKLGFRIYFKYFMQLMTLNAAIALAPLLIIYIIPRLASNGSVILITFETVFYVQSSILESIIFLLLPLMIVGKSLYLNSFKEFYFKSVFPNVLMISIVLCITSFAFVLLLQGFGMVFKLLVNYAVLVVAMAALSGEKANFKIFLKSVKAAASNPFLTLRNSIFPYFIYIPISILPAEVIILLSGSLDDEMNILSPEGQMSFFQQLMEDPHKAGLIFLAFLGSLTIFLPLKCILFSILAMNHLRSATPDYYAGLIERFGLIDAKIDNDTEGNKF